MRLSYTLVLVLFLVTHKLLLIIENNYNYNDDTNFHICSVITIISCERVIPVPIPIPIFLQSDSSKCSIPFLQFPYQ